MGNCCITALQNQIIFVFNCFTIPLFIIVYMSSWSQRIFRKYLYFTMLWRHNTVNFHFWYENMAKILYAPLLYKIAFLIFLFTHLISQFHFLVVPWTWCNQLNINVIDSTLKLYFLFTLFHWMYISNFMKYFLREKRGHLV